jgi:hypothetical protein
MMLLQGLSVIFGLFMIYVVRIHRRKENISAFEYGVWLAIWTIFIFLAIFPETVQGLTQRLSIARVFDLLVVVALMIVVFLTFQNRLSYKKLEKKLESLVRRNALTQKDKK